MIPVIIRRYISSITKHISGFTITITINFMIDEDSYITTMTRNTNLSTWGRGNPSSDQETCGVGAPDAMHFKLTEGPG